MENLGKPNSPKKGLKNSESMDFSDIDEKYFEMGENTEEFKALPP